MSENIAKTPKTPEVPKTETAEEVQDQITVVEWVNKQDKVPAPINNEADILLALESNISDQGPVIELGASSSATGGARCSTCTLCKPDNQSLIEHNISKDHGEYLILARGINFPVCNLDPEYSKILTIKCKHCLTDYPNSLLYNVHKLEDEHRRRKSGLLPLVYLASEKPYIRRWNKITKPKKTTAENISKALKYFKKYSKRSE